MLQARRTRAQRRAARPHGRTPRLADMQRCRLHDAVIAKYFIDVHLRLAAFANVRARPETSINSVVFMPPATLHAAPGSLTAGIVACYLARQS